MLWPRVCLMTSMVPQLFLERLLQSQEPQNLVERRGKARSNGNPLLKFKLMMHGPWYLLKSSLQLACGLISSACVQFVYNSEHVSPLLALECQISLARGLIFPRFNWFTYSQMQKDLELVSVVVR